MLELKQEQELIRLSGQGAWRCFLVGEWVMRAHGPCRFMDEAGTGGKREDSDVAGWGIRRQDQKGREGPTEATTLFLHVSQ